MQITLKCVGTKPLLLHNVELANPRNPWARKITELRGIPTKRRTDEWLDEMEYAEFMGAFYDIPELDGPGLPAENIRQSLIGAAKITRQGTAATRAVMLVSPSVPIIYDGPAKQQELWDDGGYKLTRMMRGAAGASPTTYPIFHEWALTVPLELEESALSPRDFETIAERAGRLIGVGACRKQGYGRYDALIS